MQQSIEVNMKTTISVAISVMFIVSTAATFDAYAAKSFYPDNLPSAAGKLTKTIAPSKGVRRPQGTR